VAEDEKCPCNGDCSCGKSDSDTWNELVQKLENTKSASVVRGYRLALSDSGTTDGYFLNFSREVSIFDFAELLEQYFGVHIDVGYDEEADETLDVNPEIQAILEFLDEEEE